MNIQMYAHVLAEWIFSFCSTSIHISLSWVAKSWGLGIIFGNNFWEVGVSSPERVGSFP